MIVQRVQLRDARVEKDFTLEPKREIRKNKLKKTVGEKTQALYLEYRRRMSSDVVVLMAFMA